MIATMWWKDPVVTGIVGAILGVLLKHGLDYLKPSQLALEHEQRKARLAYLQQQLHEFYWPLYAGLTRDEAVWELRKLCADLPEKEQEAIQKSIESEIILPNHSEMVEVIQRYQHLAGYAETPKCYAEYLRHVAAFQALRAANRYEPPSTIGVPWPEDFEQEIRTRTKELTKEYATLTQQVLLSR